MRRYETVTIASVIDSIKTDAALHKRLMEQRAVQTWTDVVGPSVATLAPAVDVRGGCLILKGVSPVLRQELVMQKINLLQQMNLILCENVVNNIRFI